MRPRGTFRQSPMRERIMSPTPWVGVVVVVTQDFIDRRGSRFLALAASAADSATTASKPVRHPPNRTCPLDTISPPIAAAKKRLASPIFGSGSSLKSPPATRIRAIYISVLHSILASPGDFSVLRGEYSLPRYLSYSNLLGTENRGRRDVSRSKTNRKHSVCRSEWLLFAIWLSQSAFASTIQIIKRLPGDHGIVRNRVERKPNNSVNRAV